MAGRFQVGLLGHVQEAQREPLELGEGLDHLVHDLTVFARLLGACGVGSLRVVRVCLLAAHPLGKGVFHVSGRGSDADRIAVDDGLQTVGVGELEDELRSKADLRRLVELLHVVQLHSVEGRGANLQRLGELLHGIALGQALLLLVVLDQIQGNAGGVVQLFLGHLAVEVSEPSELGCEPLPVSSSALQSASPCSFRITRY